MPTSPGESQGGTPSMTGGTPQDIEAADAALSEGLQQVLDLLHESLSANQQQAESMLRTVTSDLRSMIRQADQRQQQIMQAVIGEIMTALDGGQAVTDTLLSQLVTQLNQTGIGVPAVQGGIGALPGQNYYVAWCNPQTKIGYVLPAGQDERNPGVDVWIGTFNDPNVAQQAIAVCAAEPGLVEPQLVPVLLPPGGQVPIPPGGVLPPMGPQQTRYAAWCNRTTGNHYTLPANVPALMQGDTLVGVFNTIQEATQAAAQCVVQQIGPGFGNPPAPVPPFPVPPAPVPPAPVPPFPVPPGGPVPPVPIRPQMPPPAPVPPGGVLPQQPSGPPPAPVPPGGILPQQPSGPPPAPVPPGGVLPQPPPVPPGGILGMPPPGGILGLPAQPQLPPASPPGGGGGTLVQTVPQPCGPVNVYVNVPPCPPCGPVDVELAPEGSGARDQPTIPVPKRPIEVSPADAERNRPGGKRTEAHNITCDDLPPELRNGLPIPGSADWCRLQPIVIQYLAGMGQKAILYLYAFVDPDTYANQWENIPEELYRRSVGGAILAAIRALAPTVARQMKEAIDTAMNLARCSVRCDVDAYIAIIGLQAILSTMKRMRIGWDGGIWATVDVTFDMPWIEKALAYIINAMCPPNIPSVPQLLDMKHRDIIDWKQFECMMLMHGCDPGVWMDVYMAGNFRLTPEALLEYARRTGMGQADQELYIWRLGYSNGADRAALQMLYDKLPPLNEAVRWASKGANTQEEIVKYGLHEGFDSRLWNHHGNSLRAQGVTQRRAEGEWMAHWHFGNPQEWTEMLYRLRPGRDADGLEFNRADWNELARLSGFPLFLRQRLMAIAYKPLTIFHMRVLASAGKLSDSDATRILQDAGHTAADSQLFAEAERIAQDRAHIQLIDGWTVPKIAFALHAGTLEWDAAKALFDKLHLDEVDLMHSKQAAEGEDRAKAAKRWCDRAENLHISATEDAYKEGFVDGPSAVGALQAAGALHDCAVSIVLSWDLQVQTKMRKDSVAAIKRGWGSGMTSAEMAAALLQEVGMDSERARRTVNVWQAQRTQEERMLAAQEVLRLVAEGEMSAPIALARLDLMGEAPREAEILVNEALGKLHTAQVAAEQKQIASIQRASKAAETLARQAAAAQRQAIAFMHKQTPVASLKKWLAKGIIGEDRFRARLKLMGYSADTVEAWFQEMCNVKGSKCVPTGGSADTAANGASGPESGT